jgi:DNA (cytosine-5)-methyltransferase 1
VVENVPEFLNWSLYPAWRTAMEALGYTLRHEILDAQFFGVPQQRKRMFMVGTRNRAFDFRGLGGQAPRPISEALDLNSGAWSSWLPEARKKPLCANTMERIRAGQLRHGRAPFWIPYFGANRNGWGLDQPIWTITTRDRYAIVHGERFRLLTVDECRKAMGFPAGYLLTGKAHLDKMLLGNAVCPPVATALLSRLQAAI